MHACARAPHKGGQGINPLQESSKAGFYSATSRFVSWLAKLDHKAHWLPDGQNLQDPTTWTNSRLITLKQALQQLLRPPLCPMLQASSMLQTANLVTLTTHPPAPSFPAYLLLTCLLPYKLHLRGLMTTTMTSTARRAPNTCRKRTPPSTK